MPNQSDPNQNTQVPVVTGGMPTVAAGSTPPVVFPQADLPPLPPDFQSVTNDAPKNASAPTPPPAESGTSAPTEVMPMMSSGAPKKKFGGNKIIATILGVLLLIGGIGGGVYLTQQQQIVTPKAEDGRASDPYGNPIPGQQQKPPAPGTGRDDNSKSTPNPSNVSGKGGACGTNYGKTCASGSSCDGTQSGTCIVDGTAKIGDGCTRDSQCGGALKCSGVNTTTSNSGQCVDVRSDTNNCGGIGNKCAANQSCTSGQCVAIQPCGTNLDCTYTTLGDQMKCTQGGTNLYCCPAGQHLSSTNTCVAGVPNACPIGRSCGEFGVDGSSSCTGTTTGISSPTAIHCCPSGKIYTLQGCVTSAQANANCLPPSALVLGLCVPYGNCQHHTGTCYVENSIGANDANDGAHPGDYVCDNHGHWTTCAAGYTCDTTKKDCVPTNGGGGGGGGGGGPTARCQNIKAYKTGATALSAADLKKLTAGDKIKFCATGTASSGSFDKARFTINGVLQADTTTKGSGGNDFCQDYTIPTGVTSFDVTAQIHHVTLDWR